MSETRDRIRTEVEAEPGIHFRGLVRALDITPGQVQHHVRRLRKIDAVVAEDHRGRTHYYPPAVDDWDRRAIAVLRRETARDVVAYLLEHGESSPGTVVDAMGIARSTLEWHLETLTETGIVEKRRVDGNRIMLVPVHPEETAELLATVDPSLAERLVDRFERLVDGLVEDI